MRRGASLLEQAAITLDRHPGEGRDPVQTKKQRRFAVSLLEGLGPGLRRDDDA